MEFRRRQRCHIGSKSVQLILRDSKKKDGLRRLSFYFFVTILFSSSDFPKSTFGRWAGFWRFLRTFVPCGSRLLIRVFLLPNCILSTSSFLYHTIDFVQIENGIQRVSSLLYRKIAGMRSCLDVYNSFQNRFKT